MSVKGVSSVIACDAKMRVAIARSPFKARSISSPNMALLGEPHEVAEAVMWLLSARSSFAIGSGLIVDGGSTID